MREIMRTKFTDEFRFLVACELIEYVVTALS